MLTNSRESKITSCFTVVQVSNREFGYGCMDITLLRMVNKTPLEYLEFCKKDNEEREERERVLLNQALIKSQLMAMKIEEQV